MSMSFDGAFVRRQGVDFAVIVVKHHVLASTTEASRMVATLQVQLGRPVVLMAQDHRGHPTWYGRRDIAKFMSRVPLQAVHWKRITLH